MVNAEKPWLLRGGDYNNTTDAGIFAYGPDRGNAYSYYSFRQSKITSKKI